MKIKNIPTEEGRSAELLVFQRKPKQAESVLLSAQLYYRAIKLNIKLFNWDRALELALKYRQHVDTVIAYRQRFLATMAAPETLKRFLAQGDVEVNWDQIKERIARDKEAEAQRPNAKPYGE